MEKPTSLDLDAQERVVSWSNEQGVTRRHIFRRIAAADWNSYFSHIAIETDGDDRVIDVATAALRLYESCILRTEGYAENSRVPMGHRVQAVNRLLDVRAQESEAPIEPGSIVVSLDALWSDGVEMVRHSGLVHRFRAPLMEHEIKLSRETSRTRVVGGSRSGRTIYPVRQKILVLLYDDLIQSVDGYAVAGRAMASREEVVREMDLMHKVAAAAQLFSWSGEREE